jgi:hypothetical protein
MMTVTVNATFLRPAQQGRRRRSVTSARVTQAHRDPEAISMSEREWDYDVVRVHTRLSCGIGPIPQHEGCGYNAKVVEEGVLYNSKAYAVRRMSWSSLFEVLRTRE